MSERLLEQIQATVRHFRLGELSMGFEVMISFVDGVQRYLEVEGDAEKTMSFGPVLSMILEAQQRGDFLLVADLLEYEVTKLVRQ
jgi:hypothetical protein